MRSPHAVFSVRVRQDVEALILDRFEHDGSFRRRNPFDSTSLEELMEPSRLNVGFW